MNRAGLRQSLGGLLDVRPEEWSRFLPVALAYGLVMASMYLLKPARNALFLDRFGVEQLPYVLVLVALIGGVAATLFARFTRTLPLDRMVLGTFVLLIGCLGGFWLLLRAGLGWSFYLFYIWVSLYGLMSTSLMWLLAGALFNAREARRLFGLVNAGGIAGVILGSLFTGWVVEGLGTENLLLVCMVLLGGALVLLYWARTDQGPASAAREDSGGALQAIAGSDLLQQLAGMAALTAVVAAIVDVQFNEIADRIFPAKDAKTAFFAQFFAYLNIFGLFFQLLITPRILRVLGVNAALLFLPLSMAVGSLAVLAVPGLLAGILVKIGDGGFRHSIHKSAVEILYWPVPAQVKQRTKVLIDTTVDNLATGLGALLVLVLANALGVSYRNLSYVTLVLIVLWVVVVFRGRSAYVDAFRQALERRDIDAGDIMVNINEPAVLKSLVDSLDSANPRQVIYALDMLAAVQAQELVAPVRGLLAHEAADVRRRSLRILQNQSGGVVLQEVEALLRDPDLGVRLEALYCLAVQQPAQRRQRLEEALQGRDRRVRSAAIGVIARYGSDDERKLIDAATMRAYFAGQGDEDRRERAQTAQLLGTFDRPGMRPFLKELIRPFMVDPAPEVVQQTMVSMGRIADPEYLPWLLDQMAVRAYRQAARQAITAYGVDGLGFLQERLFEDELDMGRRVQIARMLGQIHCQEAVDLLLGGLERVGPMLQYHMIKSLSKLRQPAELYFDTVRIAALLDRALAEYGEIVQVIYLIEQDRDSDSGRLLRRALEEKQKQNRSRIFRLLGLQYAQHDMYLAYLGFKSGEPTTRSSALEFLDNVLPRELKLRLLPLLDHASADQALSHGREVSGRHIADWQQSLEYLVQGADEWLRTCAIYSIDRTDGRQVELVRSVCDDPHPVVRETAVAVLKPTP
ncbi:MAG: hypothetical protein GKR89_27365 [Candidatus Latescibacteria bacterium]|nr:hypothetical protein [Candidatus Latescibacterota bacterium]